MTDIDAARGQAWHKGPPPEIGWWPASTDKNPSAIRWWDGSKWSFPAFPHHSADEARTEAASISFFQAKIEWSERWWEKKK